MRYRFKNIFLFLKRKSVFIFDFRIILKNFLLLLPKIFPTTTSIKSFRIFF